ncbi:membrane protein insertase YidC [Neptunitalea chrysea]|uniref:Membrane protein insertase YidC n=1 Tax=Neptunitalea chrysea TaxID=1647581 RepID=A0A9W6EU67_9FLAO|nr:membrane protein insertase YidC [Neptunitalea chrysea]GLB52219.1 membrane protein insertase YidC [Neptunitalea chrysea]
MEEKKLDTTTIIGFVLITAILIWMLYDNQKNAENQTAEATKTEQVDSAKTTAAEVIAPEPEKEFTLNLADSTELAKYKNSLGPFAYSATLESNAKSEFTEVENEKLYLKISNKGGQIIEARLKEFTTYDSVPVYLVKDKNASFGIELTTNDNRTFNTKDLYFEPTETVSGDQEIVTMRLKTSADTYLEYRYTLKKDDYLIDFAIQSKGLNGAVNTSKPITLDWSLNGIRHAKSASYENRYTRLTYNHEDEKVDKLSQSGDDEEVVENTTWLSFRQHFFSSILISDKAFKTADLKSKNLIGKDVNDADVEFTKAYAASLPLELSNGEFNYEMHMYYGPTDYKVLKQYKEYGIDESMPTGWGIFGIINRWIIMPVFDFLVSFLPAGFAIIALTILVKLVLSPVQYKQFVSQAKMKVLRPEMDEINKKYEDQPMKKQQETMSLYKKAGVNPMSGCLPAVLQMPVFYALFTFFPTAFILRQKSFLWADDLSSYDSVIKLPFDVPFYGSHVSLFPILASIAIFIYMQMTSAQSMAQQQQPGMPNMKFLLYLSPVMMLVFFNQYASGLSLYYFVSNTITIFIMLAIKKFIIDEDKIHAKIQENKKKPKKEGKFQQRLKKMMEQAEAQQKGKK